VDDDPQAGIGRITKKLQAAGIAVSRAQPKTFSLEDVFIAEVEQARIQGKVGSED
jgi:hypothetical protein